MKRNILEDAQDIAVVGLGTREDTRIYSAKPSLAFQKEAYQKSLVDTDLPEFQGHWQFNEENGITGSSTHLALRFDQKVLRPSGL